MTNHPWESINFPYQSRTHHPAKKSAICEGFDTETKGGFAKVLSDSEQWIEINDLDSALSFLTQPKNSHRLNLFWNLNFDFSVIFKYSPRILDSVWREGVAKVDGYRIHYLPRKRLLIKTPEGASFNFYDIWQFYKSKLDDASQKYLHTSPSKMKESRDRLFQLYTLKQIGNYCREDSLKTKMLGQRLIDGLAAQNLFIRKLYSPAYVSQEYLLNTVQPPILWNLPRRIAQLYWQAYRGGWFDTYKRGVMKVTSYDLASAYPSALWELPDIRDGIWYNEIRPDAAMGVVECEAKCGMEQCQPLAIQEQGVNIYPVYDRSTPITMTLGEYVTYREFMDLEVKNAFSFVASPNARYPYRAAIEHLYAMKRESPKDSPEYLTTKVMLNAFYGKTCEIQHRNGKFYAGKMFNPAYAAETTARTRIKMFNAMRPYASHIVSILTDGVMFDTNIPLKTGNNMGDFVKKEVNTNCLVLQSGVYQYEKGRTATRGFSAKNNLWEACDTNKELVKVITHRVRGYKECLAAKKYSEIGTFFDDVRYINLGADLKRVWFKNRGRDLLEDAQDSSPTSLGVIEDYIRNRSKNAGKIRWLLEQSTIERELERQVAEIPILA